MTFGAMPAWEAVLLLGAAAGVAAWLFLLKLRPPRVYVPSLIFWRRVLDESREMTLWERIRRAVSLALTVAIAGLIALAIARPSTVGASSGGPRGRLLIVVDSSWSMLAKTRHGETRWDRAVAEARRLAAGASGDEVILATTADGLVEGPTSDLALIESGLDRIAPAGGETSAWPRMAGTQVAHFITDGTVARPLDPGVIVDSVFEPAPNAAITAFEVRPALEAGRIADAYLEIANFASSGQAVRLVLRRGAAVVHDRQMQIGKGEVVRLVVPLAAGGDPLLRARIEASADALAIDDEASAWIAQARPLSVTIVSKQPAWLANLLRLDPLLRVSVADPATFHAGQEDAIVFDRWAPPQAPARPALYFAPPAEGSWLAAAPDQPPGPVEEVHPRWKTTAAHPVVAGVDPFTLTIDRAHAYRTPGLVPIASSEQGTPLISVDQSAGRRSVVVAFGPGESNLAAAPAFPVLVGNALEWLARPDIGGAKRPGEIVFDDRVASVTGPDGRKVPLQRVDRAAIGVLRMPGVYTVESGGAKSMLPVNVGDPQVSDVERTSLEAAGTRTVTAGASSRPWWLYLGLIAFALVLLEWWTWQRRITV